MFDKCVDLCRADAIGKAIKHYKDFTAYSSGAADYDLVTLMEVCFPPPHFGFPFQGGVEALGTHLLPDNMQGENVKRSLGRWVKDIPAMNPLRFVIMACILTGELQLSPCYF